MEEYFASGIDEPSAIPITRQNLGATLSTTIDAQA
jgi:hypothetical protein